VSSAVRVRALRLILRLFALDSLEDFFAVYRNFSGSVHTKAYLIAFHTKDSHGDIIANDYRFPNPTGQDQHSQTPSGPAPPLPMPHSPLLAVQ
jgi:hypothetical protein